MRKSLVLILTLVLSLVLVSCSSKSLPDTVNEAMSRLLSGGLDVSFTDNLTDLSLMADNFDFSLSGSLTGYLTASQNEDDNVVLEILRFDNSDDLGRAYEYLLSRSLPDGYEIGKNDSVEFILWYGNSSAVTFLLTKQK